MPKSVTGQSEQAGERAPAPCVFLDRGSYVIRIARDVNSAFKITERYPKNTDILREALNMSRRGCRKPPITASVVTAVLKGGAQLHPSFTRFRSPNLTNFGNVRPVSSVTLPRGRSVACHGVPPCISLHNSRPTLRAVQALLRDK